MTAERQRGSRREPIPPNLCLRRHDGLIQPPRWLRPFETAAHPFKFRDRIICERVDCDDDRDTVSSYIRYMLLQVDEPSNQCLLVRAGQSDRKRSPALHDPSPTM